MQGGHFISTRPVLFHKNMKQVKQMKHYFDSTYLK
ncbi:MAG: hypothetical protein JWQ34_2379 [Mucilaginibacter sp.]|nr:hypothetical protein [Mucilaginibacter sp.]